MVRTSTVTARSFMVLMPGKVTCEQVEKTLEQIGPSPSQEPLHRCLCQLGPSLPPHD